MVTFCDEPTNSLLHSSPVTLPPPWLFEAIYFPWEISFKLTQTLRRCTFPLERTEENKFPSRNGRKRLFTARACFIRWYWVCWRLIGGAFKPRDRLEYCNFLRQRTVGRRVLGGTVGRGCLGGKEHGERNAFSTLFSLFQVW